MTTRYIPSLCRAAMTQRGTADGLLANPLIQARIHDHLKRRSV